MCFLNILMYNICVIGKEVCNIFFGIFGKRKRKEIYIRIYMYNIGDNCYCFKFFLIIKRNKVCI